MKRLVVLLEAVLAGCATHAAPTRDTPTAALPAKVLVRIERSSCFGSCPAYRLEIGADGAVRFDARGHICVEGPGSERLPAEKLAALRAAIARSPFATTPEHCCDLPCSDTSVLTLTVMLEDPPMRKTIADSDCPESQTTVRDLASAIEAIVGIERWIGTPAQREACP